MIATIMMIIMFFMFGVVLTYFRRISDFESYIKENETVLWEALGKPGGIKDMFFPLGTIKIYIFLYRNKYKNLTDPVAIQKAISLKNTITLFFVGFVGINIYIMHPYILAIFA